MSAHPRGSLWSHVASGPSPETAERMRKFGWTDALPWHFSIEMLDMRLTQAEFEQLKKIGSRLWGERIAEGK